MKAINNVRQYTEESMQSRKEYKQHTTGLKRSGGQKI